MTRQKVIAVLVLLAGLAGSIYMSSRSSGVIPMSPAGAVRWDDKGIHY